MKGPSYFPTSQPGIGDTTKQKTEEGTGSESNDTAQRVTLGVSSKEIPRDKEQKHHDDGGDSQYMVRVVPFQLAQIHSNHNLC
jgi:hypothetical protein